MRFTKIKYDGSKMRLEYEQERADGSDPDEFTLLSADKPAPEFEIALNALSDDVVEICEFEPHYAAQIDVRGVTLTWADGVMGACITALKRLTTANAPLVLNTPHLMAQPRSEANANEPVLPDVTVARLGGLIEQAERYLNGERAQGSLFVGKKTTAA